MLEFFEALKGFGPYGITVLGFVYLASKLLENTALTSALSKKIDGSTPKDVVDALEGLKSTMATREDQLTIKANVEDLQGQYTRLQEQVDSLQGIACSTKDCPNRHT